MKLLGFVLLCFVWGTSWVAIKFSLEGFPPFLGASARFFVAIAMLYLYARARRQSVRIPRGALGLILLTGLLVYLVDYGLIYWAEQYLNAGVTAIFFATFPLFTGILSHFFFRNEPFRSNVYLGLLIGLAGVAVVFADELARTSFDRQVMLAIGGVLIAALSGALSSVLVKVRLSKIPAASLALQQTIVGSVGLLLVGLALGEAPRVTPTASSILAVLYLAVAASALAFTLYYWLLQSLSAVSLSMVVYFTPVVAVIFDWWLLGQTVTPKTILGMLMIFSGVLISQLHLYHRARSRPGAIPGTASALKPTD